ncbi:RagB/SusD family nutrient uptake outer membrane protein [Reichenbachiella sp. MSK19-1]|uniref:RagB/SusD family nutrient uptake outer membrane protein n=1 Tax=Reichenbachiella sp. MSK19-1 TaxID=1897631 RepID=UPI000E6BF404|nr:RagB/SusD family nutrient uptake outer membrane protein [Reichenbachiella sp. MSK19-1]RJE75427.1 glycan metabolism protein RagB [Reichenbachiella sp. MSK19-1]
MNKNILIYLAIIFVLVGCDDLIEPAIENNRGLEEGFNEPRFAHGLLQNGYGRIPTIGNDLSDMATDNAVSNDQDDNFYALGTGQWAANNNPMEQWSNSRAAIQYLNLMLETVDSVKFSETPVVNEMFQDRITGEIYGLRALFMYYLLQAHGGMSNGGELLGVPIVLESKNLSSEFNVPRATFEQCMQQFYADSEAALALLPDDYTNIGDESLIPEKYVAEGAGVPDYERVFGDDARLLISGRIVRAVRAQAALMATSPAFSANNSTTWADAAAYAAEVIDLNGGVAGLAADGVTWFDDVSISDVGGGVNPDEILWRTSIADVNSDLEADNYPPTLFGNGLVNPTQNLVDAFPMDNGYPITDPSSGFDPSDPYTGRDPRLRQFIIVNGDTFGASGGVVNTAVDGDTNDGLNQSENATRTGYYLRKLLRSDVNLDPNATNGQAHLDPHIRYTEIYLIYAEAANEAFGPTGTGGNAYSAVDVISAIRQRAGLGTAGTDPYLTLAQGSTEDMRELIKNERRLELCFEGFRFWDLRRWEEDLTEAALGVRIENGNHQIISVENRVFDDYMIYGPVPFNEMLKYGALEQNMGW